MRFCVIGGMNLDITGYCEKVYLPKDSNPGSIGFSVGGVGRNIASALIAHGHETSLITALSSDIQGDILKKRCEAEGIDLSLSVHTDVKTPVYMSVHSPDGDMQAAVNDMSAMEWITPEAIRERAGIIDGFDAVIIEANLSEKTLFAAAEAINRPLIADAVSASKCRRLLPVINKLDAVKLNRLEAEYLTGQNDASEAARILLERGVGSAVISMGSEGVYTRDTNGEATLRPNHVYTCQTTGAGDAMCSGLAIGRAMGLSAKESAELGMSFAEELLEKRELK